MICARTDCETADGTERESLHGLARLAQRRTVIRWVEPHIVFSGGRCILKNWRLYILCMQLMVCAEQAENRRVVERDSSSSRYVFGSFVRRSKVPGAIVPELMGYLVCEVLIDHIANLARECQKVGTL